FGGVGPVLQPHGVAGIGVPPARDVPDGVDVRGGTAGVIADDAVVQGQSAAVEPAGGGGGADGEDDQVGGNHGVGVQDDPGGATVVFGEAAHARAEPQAHAVADVQFGEAVGDDIAELGDHGGAQRADHGDRAAESRCGGGDLGTEHPLPHHRHGRAAPRGGTQGEGVVESAQHVHARGGGDTGQRPRGRAGGDHDVVGPPG